VNIRSDGSLTGDVVAAASPLKMAAFFKADRYPQKRPRQMAKK